MASPEVGQGVIVSSFHCLCDWGSIGRIRSVVVQVSKSQQAQELFGDEKTIASWGKNFTIAFRDVDIKCIEAYHTIGVLLSVSHFNASSLFNFAPGL
jgi:hypothetical protein